MSNNYFTFKQFAIYQDRAVFKVGTDGVLLGATADVTGTRRILDIGTGTGLIAIMLAQRCDADIVAIEPDDNSYMQAVENVKACRWSNKIQVVHSDLQSYSADNEKFGLIVINPPYFNESLKNPDPRKSRSRHNDNLSSVEILKSVTSLLADDGRLQMIMPYVEGTVFIAEANSFGLYCNNILKIKSLPTSDIRRLIMTFTREMTKTTGKFLTIERGKRYEFTEEYISLTKDFYLKF